MRKNLLNCQIIMLPTKNKSILMKDNHANDIFHLIQGEQKIISEDYTNQHLYLVSNREIERNGWFIDLETSKIYQVLGSTDLTFLNHRTKKHPYKKIEATTDHELNIKMVGDRGVQDEEEYNVPKIPNSFIKAYVESQGKIKSVQIELDQFRTNYKYKVKVRENNSCIIHQAKSYSRDEVKTIVWRALGNLKHLQLMKDSEKVDKWIEENL